MWIKPLLQRALFYELKRNLSGYIQHKVDLHKIAQYKVNRYSLIYQKDILFELQKKMEVQSCG